MLDVNGLNFSLIHDRIVDFDYLQLHLSLKRDGQQMSGFENLRHSEPLYSLGSLLVFAYSFFGGCQL